VLYSTVVYRVCYYTVTLFDWVSNVFVVLLLSLIRGSKESIDTVTLSDELQIISAISLYDREYYRNCFLYVYGMWDLSVYPF
jgi:hypothetical protein